MLTNSWTTHSSESSNNHDVEHDNNQIPCPFVALGTECSCRGSLTYIDMQKHVIDANQLVTAFNQIAINNQDLWIENRKLNEQLLETYNLLRRSDQQLQVTDLNWLKHANEVTNSLPYINDQINISKINLQSINELVDSIRLDLQAVDNRTRVLYEHQVLNCSYLKLSKSVIVSNVL